MSKIVSLHEQYNSNCEELTKPQKNVMTIAVLKVAQ